MRVWVIRVYLETKSYARVYESFQGRFGDEYSRCKSTIKRIVDRFVNEYQIEDASLSGRWTVRTLEKGEEERAQITPNPHLSIRKLSRRVGLSDTSTLGTLHNLKLHPCHVSVRQELKEANYEKRVRFCNWFLHFMRRGLGLLDEVFLSDKAWVHLSGYVNAQNYRL